MSRNSSGGIRFGRVVVLLAAYILATLVMTWFVVDFPAGKPMPHSVPLIIGDSQ